MKILEIPSSLLLSDSDKIESAVDYQCEGCEFKGRMSPEFIQMKMENPTWPVLCATCLEHPISEKVSAMLAILIR